MDRPNAHVIWFEDMSRGDVATVGGKNASIGELVRNLAAKGIRTPTGFATTTSAYWAFIDANALRPVLETALDALASGEASLQETGQRIRAAIAKSVWPAPLAREIREAYRALAKRVGRDDPDVAVRSSATAGSTSMSVTGKWPMMGSA